MIDVMSFGGGVQSTTVLTLAGEGLIPMPKHWVFSDPRFETQKTYAHIERCKEYLAKRGAVLDVVSAGDIRQDAFGFALRPVGGGKEVMKRYASIPMFVDKGGGDKEGVLPRQCTTEFKIEPIEKYHRQVVMGLKARQRAPKEPTVNVWIGISHDEERRVSAPGRWRLKKQRPRKDLFGGFYEPKPQKVWVPCPWQEKMYPLLGYVVKQDRTRVTDPRFAECEGWDRDDCFNWLAKVWPFPVPRSACICCPYRTNDEWRDMRDHEPGEFAQAVEFDHKIREAYATGLARRGKPLAGVPYLHRTRKPLDMVDLTEPLNDRMGCGGLYSQEPDGICGV